MLLIFSAKQKNKKRIAKSDRIDYCIFAVCCRTFDNLPPINNFIFIFFINGHILHDLSKLEYIVIKKGIFI